MSVEKYDWAIKKSLFASTHQDSKFSHTRENSKTINTTSKHFSFFKNKPPASAYNKGFSYMLFLFVS